VVVLGLAVMLKSDTIGTICRPFTGARSYPVEAVLGMAEIVKLGTFGMVKTT
jgi:hypothetical protein